MWHAVLLNVFRLFVIVQVTRAAEEAAATFSKSISPDECMTVLSPLISDSTYPVNLAGIKMLTKVCIEY